VKASEVACPFCQALRAVEVVLEAQDYEYGVPGTYQLGKCTSCGFHFQVPLPPPGEIGGFYPDGYVTYVDSGPSLSRWLTRRYYLCEGQRIARLIGRQGAVLDVGCGSGLSLEMFSRCGAWKLAGVEIDTRSIAEARRRGFQVWQGRFEELDLPSESFDLVRMSHYLEHVVDPLNNLRQVHRILKPGGILYAEIPSIEGLDFAFWGRYWGALHFPRHLVFPSRRHMRELLRQVGLRDVSVLSRLRTCGWSAGIQNFLHARFGLRVPNVGGRVSWYPVLIAFCLPLSVIQALCDRPGAVAYVARKATVN
jgi:SAM-dependent methyltransferase